jgi:hypothetical protein
VKVVDKSPQYISGNVPVPPCKTLILLERHPAGGKDKEHIITVCTIFTKRENIVTL